ncbi:MAG: Sec-independent protein translocase protein TatB [Bradyrhizobium sp.]
MFDIGWSEFALIAVVALIAIGPKELPGVLRMVGQWVGKARKMAAEFQGQFQEAMREAEMADLKKSFDEVKEAASGFTTGNLMTSLQKDVSSALDVSDKPTTPLETAVSETISPTGESVSSETTTSPAEVQASEPLAIAPVTEPPSAIPDTHSVAVEGEVPRDAKAS